MLEHPVEQGSFKSDVTPLLLALKPLVSEDLLTLRQELPVEGRVFQQVTGISGCKGSCHWLKLSEKRRLSQFPTFFTHFQEPLTSYHTLLHFRPLAALIGKEDAGADMDEQHPETE